MPTTGLVRTPRPPRPAAFGRPSVRERVGEIAPLFDLVPFDGPPLIFLVGPWLFLGLMLAAPFAVLVTFAVLMMVALALAAAAVAILASPFVLLHRLRAARAAAWGID